MQNFQPHHQKKKVDRRPLILLSKHRKYCKLQLNGDDDGDGDNEQSTSPIFLNCTQRRSSSVLPTQVHGTSLLKFNTSLIIQFRDRPIYFTMPAPTRLLQPTEGAENVSVPVVAEQDDELLLDIQDVNPADPNAIAPPPTSEDTEMVVDEEGRPRFAPGKDVVRCGTGLRMRRKKAIFNKILVNCF